MRLGGQQPNNPKVYTSRNANPWGISTGLYLSSAGGTGSASPRVKSTILAHKLDDFSKYANMNSGHEACRRVGQHIAVSPRRQTVKNNIPEEPDKSQLEPKRVCAELDKRYSAWLNARFGAPVKLECDHKVANQPESNMEQMGSEPLAAFSPSVGD